MRDADGTYRWVHDTLARRSTATTAVDYFLGFMTDITERAPPNTSSASPTSGSARSWNRPRR